MVSNLVQGGKDFLYSKQTSVLSAAVVIMSMLLASRVLGLFRNRIFVHFFPPEHLDTFLAAFQLPDLIFEILILGAMSSAFIPVFSGYLSRNKEKEAWRVASIALNLLLVFYFVFSIFILLFAHPIYSTVVRGFSSEQILEIVSFTRYLLIAQLFFLASYLLTAVLETHQRFLVSASAPLFYNLGIIGCTALFAGSLGLMAPVLGVVVGSMMHFLVQLPVAVSLGFRPVFSLDYKNPGVQEIWKLALPRIIELTSFQLKKFTDLSLASLVAGNFTYFKFADSLATLPIGLFGLSIAKASLPKLSTQATKKGLKEFKETLSSSIKEILFLVIPASIFLGVLRLPLVRLVYGAENFDWTDTLETGYVVTAFSVGIFAYALTLLLSRAFYALKDTVTPVKISILTIVINASLGYLFILVFKMPIWGLALAYSIAGLIQIAVLFHLLIKKIGGFTIYGIEKGIIKMTSAAAVSSLLMFVLLKVLDRSAWDKQLSFLGQLGLALPTTFDKYILDTRYTVNLIFITATVALIGFLTYLVLSYLFKVEELKIVFRVITRLPGVSKIPLLASLKPKEREPLVPPPHSNGA